MISPAPKSESESKPRRWLMRVFRMSGLAAIGAVLLLSTLWAAAALLIDVRVPWLRAPLAVAYVAAALAVWVFVKGGRRKAGATFGGFVVALAWWLTLRPSTSRDWQPDLAVLPSAEISGNTVTLRNIRNCDYRTETDFDVHYYDRTLNLEELRTVDFYLVYWGSPHMAHAMASFGFENGGYICFSIECRKEKGESYSAVKGLFRQFELIYVAADERDLVRLRTNYRQGEEAYLYRAAMTPEQAREFFLAYIRRVNELHRQPEWYNAITDNCTTAIRAQRAAQDRAPWDWRMLVNGHLDELMYKRGMISTNLPFAELKRRSHINSRAKSADKAADFSKRIRQTAP